jgi:hypothetical protein
MEIITDQGTQFMNQTLRDFALLSGIKHHSTIPYSKEENGICERANKEVNRHIRNILSDMDDVKNWSQVLCMTEKLLNSSVKQPLGVSPNTLLFGNAINNEAPAICQEMDSMPKNGYPQRSMRDYVDNFMYMQGKLIEAAMKSQVRVNEENLQKRYAKYPKLPKHRREAQREEGTTQLALITATCAPKRQPIYAAKKWIIDPSSTAEAVTYIRLVTTDIAVLIDSVDEIDIDPYLVTRYQVGDYVLRRYPSTKIGGGNPNKYGSWWRGPYRVMSM